MDYRQFLKEHGVMPWQYPVTPTPDYVWKIQDKQGQFKYVGTFESKEIAHAYVQHHNDDAVWAQANLPATTYQIVTAYQLVEVLRPRILSAEEISENIRHILQVMEIEGEFD